MKLTSLLPFVLYASLASAKLKKPKGSGSSETEEEDQEQQAAGATDTAVVATETTSSTLDVGEVISSFYPTQNIPTVAPSVSTALAKGLLSVESSWFASPEYTSADAAISRALPLSLSASVLASGYLYGEIMTASWFTKSVPAALQTAVVEYVSAVEAVHIKYVETTTSAGAFTALRTGSATPLRSGAATATATAGNVATNVAGSGAVMTGAPMMVAGIVGAVGVVVAAVL